MEKLLTKISSIIGSLFLFGAGFTGLHEYGHWQTAQWVGVPGGRIEFTFFNGFYFYPEGFIPTSTQDFLVRLGGGITVALFFAFYWVIRQKSLNFSEWDIDDTFALVALGLGQLFYGFTEAVKWYWQGGLIPTSLGFIIACIIYGKRILRWLNE